MSTVLLLLANILGALVFLFFLWKRLKEDYPSGKIFTLGFFVIGGIILSVILSLFLISPGIKKTYFFDPSDLWFWTSFLISAVITVLYLVRSKMRFFEGIEAGSIGLSFWFFLLLFSSSLINKDIQTLIYAVIVAALICLFFFLDKKYKSFTWYKSGKVGFSGLSLLSIFFLVRAGVALVDPTMLSFIGKIDALVSAILSFLFFLSVYNLGGSYE